MPSDGGKCGGGAGGAGDAASGGGFTGASGGAGGSSQRRVQVTAKILFGSVSAIASMRSAEKSARSRRQLAIAANCVAPDSGSSGRGNSSITSGDVRSVGKGGGGDGGGRDADRRKVRGFERAAVVRAADFGLERMRVLMEEYEPRLYHSGAVLSSRAPGHYVAAFNAQGDRERKLAQFGYAALQATSLLVQRAENDDPDDDEDEGDLLEVRGGGGGGGGGGGEGQRRGGRGWRVARFPRVSLRHTALGRQCPMPAAPRPCPGGRDVHVGAGGGAGGGSKFRSYDGRCNAPEHPERGTAGTPLRRLLPAHYKDGVERGREAASGGPLPSARAVSVAVHGPRDVELAAVTHLVMQWGQLIDHDLTASAQSRGFNASVPKCCTDDGSSTMPTELLHPDCMAIPVARDDWFLGPLGVRCLEFVRSGAAPRPGCALGPRDQLNRVTAFLDGSAVYGSSAADARRLRLRTGGLLRYRRVTGRLPLLPLRSTPVELCTGEARSGGACFDAGDGRVNEQPGLIAAHALLLRAHNRLATRLAHLNAHWSDERLFQEARRLLGAAMQHVTYREFLPLVLGPDVVKSFGLELTKRGYYNGYDPHVNPAISNAFATAAFRFGHSLVQNSLLRCDRSHRPLVGSNVSLHEELTKPNYIHHAGSVDKLLLGMCAQPAQKRDEFITEQLTNHLFQTKNFHWGMDLAALNIQRGRDHGLAPYNSWREACGLQPFTNWIQMLKVMSPETQRKLKKMYRDIDDIDLFPGAMAEKPVSGGLVGPTFSCIIAQQFSNLRRGDRFWYENGGFVSSFTPAQLQQIRKISLARILCDNLDSIDTIQPFVFLAADSDKNKHLPCEKIANFDLTPWTEHRIVNEHDHHNDHHEDHYHHDHHHYEPPTTQLPSYHHHHHDSYHTDDHHSHHDTYNKPSTPFPLEEPVAPSYHQHSYQKPQTSSHDHYKPPHDDYQKPILLNPSTHYDYTTSKPVYNVKPHNNYSITYIYEFDLEHKPQPTPSTSYIKPKPTIKPTPSYTVIHVHQTVEHHSSSSDSYLPHHSKPHHHTHSKPHHNGDSYLPDHLHDHSDSYHSSSDSYAPPKPSNGYFPPQYTTEKPYHKPYPNLDTGYKPPSIDNYGPDVTHHSDHSNDHYKPPTDSYHIHKPHFPESDSYQPPISQTYKPPSNNYGHPIPHNKPSSGTYGHTNPPTKYRPPTTSDSYGFSNPNSNNYGHQKPLTEHHEFTINNKVTLPSQSSYNKPSHLQSPTPINYPKPQIIYTDAKPPAYDNYPQSNNPLHNSKPILLKGLSSDYTVIEVPHHSHRCKSSECSPSSSSIINQEYSHNSYQPSHGLKGDPGIYSSNHVKHQQQLKSKPLQQPEENEKPIILYTSPSSKASGSQRLKGNTILGQKDQAVYHELETSPELPSPDLGAGNRQGTHLKNTNASDKWTFDARENDAEEELPDVLYLPSDPDSVRELPRPIVETEEDLSEDEELISRSL